MALWEPGPSSDSHTQRIPMAIGRCTIPAVPRRQDRRSAKFGPIPLAGLGTEVRGAIGPGEVPQ